MKKNSLNYFGFLILISLLFSTKTYSQTINYADAVTGYSTQYTTGNWSAAQVLGYPNTYPTYGDIPTAWASLSADGQREFLELSFTNAMPIDSIWIYETLAAGAVDTIYVKNPGTLLWEIVCTATAFPVAGSQILKVGFPMTAFAVSDIRIAINSPAVPSWNEIDAVAIVNSTPDLVSLCDGDSLLIGSTYKDTPGIYADSTIVDADLYLITLSVVNSSSSTQNISACDSYVSPSGLYVWNTSNTYMDTISNVAGCDSIMTINLTINTVDVSTIEIDNVSTANATGATYQWLDCDNAYAVIPGETNQNFIATSNGNYAVEVTENGCTDTSACVFLGGVGIDEVENKLTFTAYPNPTSGSITLDFVQEQDAVEIIITNSLGQIISQKNYFNTQKLILEMGEMSGVYFVEVRSELLGFEFIKVIKE